MAAEDRPTGGPLEDAARFSFFQLVRLLEQHYRPRARVGGEGPAAEEILRFRPEVSLGFPASDVAAVEEIPATEDQPARFQVTTTFLGLYGSTSPLPIFYTEEMIRRDPDEDPVRAFVDLFHHRLLSLFYRCWTKYRYHIQFEGEGKDAFSQRMLGLIGLGTAGLTDQTGLPAARLIRYAGLLTQRPRSAAALEGMVSDFFGDLPVRAVQWVARWVTIQPEQQIRLGQVNSRLGVDASLGEKILSRSSQFRMVLGPMRHALFLQFLPDGESFRRLNALVILFLNDPLEFDFELQVHGEEIPPLQLKSRDGGRLGWTTWLTTAGFDDARPRSVVLERGSLN
ncbi:MAG: type VI secretion system baseplate subunit TssG [Candidatus Manganitrophaceae bacterium]|nr:MAG: type VI secretion system baseplate subunit TssG [Candidatus Manganitrophaceae bacterium]